MTAQQYIAPKITAKEILEVVEQEAGVKLTNIDLGTFQRLTKIHREYIPRVVAVTVMMQEGITVVTIARALGITNGSVYRVAELGAEQLNSRPGNKDYNKEFKTLFLVVMARIAELEDKAA